MDKQSKKLFTPAVLTKICQLYGADAQKIKPLDGFENFMYEYPKNGEPRILRISHDLHRTANAIIGEIEWLNYLADNGLSVPRALPADTGALVETVEAKDGSHFSAVSFTKAPGKHPWEQEIDLLDLALPIGQMIGRMHALTKKFTPSQPAFKRPEWDADAQDFAEKYLPDGNEIIAGKFGRLTRSLQSLPKDVDSYGLIHFDFHSANFFVHNGQITLFDFDDCQYNWFVADLAIALFYAVSHNCAGRKAIEQAQRFYNRLIEGYAAENTLDKQWPALIPMFLKQREIDLFIAIHRSLDLNKLDRWAASFMEDRKRKIEKDVPYAPIEFGR